MLRLILLVVFLTASGAQAQGLPPTGCPRDNWILRKIDETQDSVHTTWYAYGSWEDWQKGWYTQDRDRIHRVRVIVQTPRAPAQVTVKLQAMKAKEPYDPYWQDIFSYDLDNDPFHCGYIGKFQDGTDMIFGVLAPHVRIPPQLKRAGINQSDDGQAPDHSF